MSLSYELAKELKDAGFPQLGNGYALIVDNPALFDNEADRTCTEISWERYVLNPNEKYGPTLYSPTLEELILEVYKFSHEVCLQSLRDVPNTWAAATCWGNGYEDDWQRGKTPVEALAKLWLTLSRENAELAQ